MEQVKYIENLKEIEKVVSAHKSRFSGLSIKDAPDSKKLESDYLALQNDKRLLKIGIVGRVKAGKSSLLNALVFGGENILPKAATPMTAALTKLEYAPNFAFQVDFFDKEDIDKIKEAAKQYKEDFAKNLATEKEEVAKNNARLTPQEVEDRAKRNVARKMKDSQNDASFDQAERMAKSGVNIQELDSDKVHECASLEDFKTKLGDYVGSNGKYMPYTKSVTLKMPFEALKDVEIVDTPGLNDPVASRSERTEKMLSECDVIFIVSPTRQFMSAEDVNLMANSITRKGVSELYIIASQADLDFHGDLKGRGNVAVVMKELEALLSVSLSRLEGEDLAVFDSLIKESSRRLICSSGIAVNIKKNLDDLSRLDDSESHALGLLKKNYPNDFPENDRSTLENNLDRISNILRVQEILNEVRANKNKIMEEKFQKILIAESNNVTTYKNELIKFLTDSKNELLSSDIDGLKNEQQMLQKVRIRGAQVLDIEFEDVTNEFSSDLKISLRHGLSGFFKDAMDETKNAEGRHTESREVSTSKWYNPFSWGSTKTKTKTYTTARASQVTAALRDLEDKLQMTLDKIYYDRFKEFKKDVIGKKLLPPLRAEIQRSGGDDDLMDPLKWRRVTSSVINEMPEPALKCRCNIPSGSGTLTGYAAESFLAAAFEAVGNLKEQVSDEIEGICQKIKQTAKGFGIGNKIFDELDGRIRQIVDDLNNKQQALDEYDSTISSLQKIGE